MNVTHMNGAWTALVTPFGERGDVDVRALRAIVEKQIERGIDGLVACGTTAETPTLRPEEQETVVRTVVEAADKRVPVMVGTGSHSTRQTIHQTLEAQKWGADSVLVVCPYYNKPTQEGMYQHFRAVHEETNVPIVVYNVPGRTASDLLPKTLGRLANEGRVVGIKDATADMARLVENQNAVGARPFSFLSGDDFTILPFVALGGHGVVSVVSNLLPGDTHTLIQKTQEGALSQARVLNQKIVRLTQRLFEVSNPIPIKAAMALAGWCLPRCRLPLVPADEALCARLREAMAAYQGEGTSSGLERFMF